MAKANPQVSFQVDDSAATGLFGWKSVSGEGILVFVANPGEIERISPVLFSRFTDAPEWAQKEYAEKQASGQLVWVRVRPMIMTGRMSTDPSKRA